MAWTNKALYQVKGLKCFYTTFRNSPKHTDGGKLASETSWQNNKNKKLPKSACFTHSFPCFLPTLLLTYQRQSAWAAGWGSEAGCGVGSSGWRSVCSGSFHRSSGSLHPASLPTRSQAEGLKPNSGVFHQAHKRWLQCHTIYWMHPIWYALMIIAYFIAYFLNTNIICATWHMLISFVMGSSNDIYHNILVENLQ